MSTLAWEDARDEARQRVRVFTRRITDRAYVEIDKVFEEAERNGEEILAVEDVDVRGAIIQALEPARRALGVSDEG